MNPENIIPDWAKGTNCAITVCDSNLTVLYMNDLSRRTFAGRGGAALIGQSLRDCHQQRSLDIMRHMLSTGESNCYTITKGGLRKMIYQTPWRDASGKIAGLVEISMIIPNQMPHYDRG